MRGAPEWVLGMRWDGGCDRKMYRGEQGMQRDEGWAAVGIGDVSG